MGKVPLLEFCQPEGFGKRSQRHLKGGQGIDETNEPPHFQFQDLGAVPHLFNDLFLPMEFADGWVTVVALKVVGKDSQRARILLGQGLEPLQEISEAGIPTETYRSVVEFRFGHHQIRHVTHVGLHALNVEENMQGFFLFLRLRVQGVLRIFGAKGL